MLAADTSRRMCHIRLESPEKRPEERTGFKHPELLTHVKVHRGELLCAVLTLLQGYFASGCPDPGLRSWGSFESWSKIVRNPVVWLGLPDPADTKQELIEQSDREANALAGILSGLKELDPFAEGMTCSKILNTLKQHPHEYQGLREGILELCYGGKGFWNCATSVPPINCQTRANWGIGFDISRIV